MVQGPFWIGEVPPLRVGDANDFHLRQEPAEGRGDIARRASPGEEEQDRFHQGLAAKWRVKVRTVYWAPTTKRNRGPKLKADAGPMIWNRSTVVSKRRLRRGDPMTRRIAWRSPASRSPSRSTSTLNPVPAMTWSKRRSDRFPFVNRVSTQAAGVLPGIRNRGRRQRFNLAVNPIVQPPGAFRRQKLGNDQGSQSIRQMMHCARHIGQEPRLGARRQAGQGRADSLPERRSARQGGHPANLIVPHDKRRVRPCLAQQRGCFKRLIARCR